VVRRPCRAPRLPGRGRGRRARRRLGRRPAAIRRAARGADDHDEDQARDDPPCAHTGQRSCGPEGGTAARQGCPIRTKYAIWAIQARTSGCGGLPDFGWTPSSSGRRSGFAGCFEGTISGPRSRAVARRAVTPLPLPRRRRSCGSVERCVRSWAVCQATRVLSFRRSSSSPFSRAAASTRRWSSVCEKATDLMRTRGSRSGKRPHFPSRESSLSWLRSSSAPVAAWRAGGSRRAALAARGELGGEPVAVHGDRRRHREDPDAPEDRSGDVGGGRAADREVTHGVDDD
jgi:hypothetical protein